MLSPPRMENEMEKNMENAMEKNMENEMETGRILGSKELSLN